MKAVCWMGTSKIETLTVEDPKLLNSRDAIIKVTRTAICGSDLHLFDGFIPTMEQGDIMGHEFMGIVEEVGPSVKNLRRGDRVVVPFTIACGSASSVKRSCGLPVITQIRTLTLWKRPTDTRAPACSATPT